MILCIIKIICDNVFNGLVKKDGPLSFSTNPCCTSAVLKDISKIYEKYNVRYYPFRSKNVQRGKHEWYLLNAQLTKYTWYVSLTRNFPSEDIARQKTWSVCPVWVSSVPFLPPGIVCSLLPSTASPGEITSSHQFTCTNNQIRAPM